MHLVTAQSAAPSFPALPDGTRLSGKPHADNGVAWQLYEHKTSFLFGFITDKGFIGTAEHETAPRAEKAARRWCAAFVAEPVFEPALALEVPDSTMMPKGAALEVVGAEAFDAAVFGEPAAAEDQDLVGGWLITTRVDGDRYAADLTDPTGASTGPDWLTNYKTEVAARTGGKLWAKTNPATEHRFSAGHRVDPAPAPAIEPLGTHEIAGWRIEVSEGRPGTFKAELFHATTGKAGALDQNFTGKDSARTALTDASIWAMQHAADVPRISAKIDGEVVDLEEIHGEADPETELWEMVRESLGEEVPGTGWYVATVDGKRGTFNAHLLREDGVVCPERFDGHTTPDGAEAEACEWARANPRWTSSDGLHDAADDIVAGWRVIVGGDLRNDGAFMVECIDEATGVIVGGAGDFAGFAGTEEAAEYGRKYARENPTPSYAAAHEVVESWQGADALALGESAEVARLRAEVDMLREQLAAQQAGMTADLDGLLAKASRHDELRLKQSSLMFQAQAIKDELKGIAQELATLGADGFDMVKALGSGARAKTWQLGLTFDSSTAVRVSVGAQAAQVVAAMATQKWAFNGTEHVIESSSQSMLYTTWIRGHRETTEGFGEDYQQAAEQTKAAASVVFADCDPGQTAPDPEVRMPAKRGRKPKLGGHDLDAVKAALLGGSLLDAAMTLGVTPQQLQRFAERNLPGLAAVDLGEHAAPAKRGRKARQ